MNDSDGVDPSAIDENGLDPLPASSVDPGAMVVRYTPDSQLRNLPQFLRGTRRSLRASWGVASRLFVRDLKSRYRQSVLGYLWLFGPPLAVTAVWVLLNAGNVVNAGETGVPYVVYVLVGTVLWQGFLDAINSPLQQFSNAAGLLSKVHFPAESLLLAGLFGVLLNLLIRSSLLIPVFIATGTVPSIAVVLAPVGALVLVSFGFGIGLQLTPVGALYKDVGEGIAIVSSFLFLVTPVVWAPGDQGAGRYLAAVNPLTPLISTARDWLTGGSAVPSAGWIAMSVVTVLMVACGWLFFRLSVPHLIDRIGL